MAKTKEQKEESVKLVKEKMSDTTAVVFTHFDGLSVMDTNEFRTVLRENNIQYTVAKRSLLKVALKDAGISVADIDGLEPGGVGVAFGYEDEVLPAKTVDTFSKTHKALTIIGGIFNGKFIDANETLALAKLPSKPELTQQFVWLLQYPISGFVNVLAGNIRNLVYALKAIQEKKA